MKRSIEEYTQQFLMLYRKNLSDAGMKEYSTQKMLISILEKTAKDWLRLSYKPSLFDVIRKK